MPNPEMRAKIANGQGFIAALDQSGGSTPKALRLYGVTEDQYSGEDEMFAEIHKMRARIMQSPSFTGDRVVGAILFEMTMDGEVAVLTGSVESSRARDVVERLALLETAA